MASGDVNYWIGGTSGNANNWSTAANWSLGTAPVTGEKVWITGSVGSTIYAITDGLNQSAVTLAELNIVSDYTGTTALIGTASAYLQIGATIVNVGLPAPSGTGAGSGRIKLNLGSVASRIAVFSTASSGTDSGNVLEPLRIIGTSASNILMVYGGVVGVGTTNPSEQATLDKLTVAGSGTVNCGPRVTLDEVWNKGGTITTRSAITVLYQHSGTTTTFGDVALATANVYGGTLIASNRKGSGSEITTLNLRGGTVNFAQNPEAVAVGTLSYRKGTMIFSQPSQPTFVAASLDVDINSQLTLSAA